MFPPQVGQPVGSRHGADEAEQRRGLDGPPLPRLVVDHLDRAEVVGLSQAIGFGIMNTAWALGNMSGPALAGTIADVAGDGVPYVLAAVLCALTLAATLRVR